MRFRSFLYSKWFFAWLLVVAIFDLAADVVELTHSEYANTVLGISIGLSALVAILAGWIFVDLHTRKPR